MPATVGVARGGGIPCEPGGGVGTARGELGVSVAVRGGNGLVCAGGAPPRPALPVSPALSTPRASRVQSIAASVGTTTSERVCYGSRSPQQTLSGGGACSLTRRPRRLAPGRDR